MGMASGARGIPRLTAFSARGAASSCAVTRSPTYDFAAGPRPANSSRSADSAIMHPRGIIARMQEVAGGRTYAPR